MTYLLIHWALECLGKHMPYYDRKIELVIIDKADIIAGLKERYTITKIVDKESLLIKGNLISVDSNVLITKGIHNILIYQRPLTSIDNKGKIKSYIKS